MVCVPKTVFIFSKQVNNQTNKKALITHFRPPNTTIMVSLQIPFAIWP